MQGDITIYDDGHGFPGCFEAIVAAGTCAQKIKAGEPVYIAVDGDNTATALATNLPSSANAASNISGIAMSNSTDTTAAAGTVQVLKLEPTTTYLIAPNVAASWDTQAEYNALVGKFVLLDLTGTAAAGTATYTILASHNAANGCIVEPLDIAKHPGKVRFSIRAAATSKGWATGIS
jgi:hypothetical protein